VQLTNLLHERTGSSLDLIRYILQAFTCRDLDELQYIIDRLKPIYERLLEEDAGKALTALRPYLAQHLLNRIPPSDVPDLNRLAMFILVASFLASYNPG
jgi:hypothetical protein